MNWAREVKRGREVPLNTSLKKWPTPAPPPPRCGPGRNRVGVRARARRSGRTHLRQVRYHGRARRFVVVPSSSEREIRARKKTRATVAPHARLRTVGSRTIHGTEVRWRRNMGVDDDDGGSCGFRGFVFFVCNGDDVLEMVSSLSFPCFLLFLVVFVVSFVSTVDDLASVGLGRKHDESSTRFRHHHSNLHYSKRWWTTIEFDWP